MKENQNIEFKQSWRDEYLQYICGFANAQGGTLYIVLMTMVMCAELIMQVNCWRICLTKSTRQWDCWRK